MKFLPVFESLKGLRPAGADGEHLGLCPFHPDRHPSLSVNLENGLWHCLSCETRGDAPGFLMRLKGLSFKEAKAEVERLTGQASEPKKASKRASTGRIVETYPYHDEQGRLLFEVVRFEPKRFAQRRPDGKDGWVWSLRGVRRVLYRLPDLAEAALVVICEGEKDVEALCKRGFIATTCPGGAGKWRTDYNASLQGKQVVILPDADPAGRAHGEKVAHSLVGVAASVKVLELPGLPAKGDVSDWLAAGGTAEELLRLVAGAPEWRPQDAPQGQPQAAPPRRVNPTDLGNGARFAGLHGGHVRYCWPWCRWLAWDGRRWAVDTTGDVWMRARAVVAAMYTEAATATDPERRAALAQHAARSESAARLGAMVELARSEPGIPVLPEQFDSDPWALNCLNGTINLRTGLLRPHRREDLISKVARVEYDPAAACPTWEAFLERILGGNRNLLEFAQRAVGYSLTGDTREQILFLLHGTGANGKSTLLETLRALLGDYSVQADPATFLAGPADSGPRPDLARLRGARLVAACEVEDGRRLAEALVKQLTGGDTVAARFLYGEHFEFKPAFKLWLAANAKPSIRGQDWAIWRRIRLIPFSVTIPPQEQDKALGEKLRGELSGILNWALEGCLAWQRDGLGCPAEVEAATDAYRSEMDSLGLFLAECCLLHPQAKAPAGALYKAYVAWAEANGERPLPQRTFGLRLAERGLEPGKSGATRLWRGVALLDDPGTHGTHRDACSSKLLFSAPIIKEEGNCVPKRPTSQVASQSPPGQGPKEWRL